MHDMNNHHQHHYLVYFFLNKQNIKSNWHQIIFNFNY